MKTTIWTTIGIWIIVVCLIGVVILVTTNTHTNIDAPLSQRETRYNELYEKLTTLENNISNILSEDGVFIKAKVAENAKKAITELKSLKELLTTDNIDDTEYQYNTLLLGCATLLFKDGSPVVPYHVLSEGKSYIVLQEETGLNYIYHKSHSYNVPLYVIIYDEYKNIIDSFVLDASTTRKLVYLPLNSVIIVSDLAHLIAYEDASPYK